MFRRKWIVAHRGDRSRAPENTLAAFRLAFESGADMAELDLRRTADGELLVFHDEAIEDLILAQADSVEVQRRGVALGFAIPRFSEVLELLQGRLRLDVELKEAGYEPRVLRLLFDHRFSVRDFVVTSFEVDAVRRLKRECPGARTGLLVENVTAPEALCRFRDVGADFLAPDHVLLDPDLLAEAAASEIALLPWTVNEDGRIRELLRAEAVLGVVTDRPAEALELRSSLRRQ